MNYKRLDLYLVVFFASIGAFTFWHFSHDSYSVQFPTKTERVAQLSQQAQTVKIKHGRDLAFIDAKRGEVLTFNDQIYTHESSSAELDFFGNGQIFIGENTLFKLVKSNDGGSLQLNLERGMVQIRLLAGEHKLKMRLPNNEILQLKAGKNADADIKIASDERGSVKLSVVKGEASAQTSEGAVHNLDTSKQMELLEGGASKIDQLSVRLLTPIFNEQRFAEETTLTWQVTGKETGHLWIRIANNADLSSPLVSEELSYDQESFVFTPQTAGIYYWQVGDSAVFSWQVKKEFPPRLLSPYAGEEFLPATELLFTWEGEEHLRYRFRLWNEGKDEILQEETVRGRKLVLPAERVPPVGEYFWTVKLEQPDRPQSPWSTPSSLIIKSPVLPAVPILLFPEKSAHYDLFAPEMTIEWQSVAEAFTYQVFIPAKNKVFTVSAPQNKLKIALVDLGDLRLRAGNKRGEYSAWSEIIPFTFSFNESFASDAPEKGAAVELKRPNEEVTFSWQKTTSASLFELARDRHFKEIIQERKIPAHFDSTKIVFPEVGVYYWRTKVIDEKGSVHFSPPRRVEVRPIPPPSKPDLDEEMEIELQARPLSFWQKLSDFLFPRAIASERFEFFVPLTWANDENAQRYVLEIYADKELKQKILRKELTKNKYDWQGAQAGVYYWRLAIIDFWNRQGPFSDLVKLKVTLPEVMGKLETTELLIPEEEDVFAENDEVNFAWKSAKNAKAIKRQELIIVKNGTIYSQTSLPSSPAQSTQKLPAGHYEWFVRSFGLYGQKSESDHRRLQVQALPAPAVGPTAAASFSSVSSIRQRSLQMRYAPLYQVQYENKTKNGDSIKLAGNVQENMSFSGTFSPSHWYSRLSADFTYLQGEVFAGEPWRAYFLDLSYAKNRSLALLYSLLVDRMSAYTVDRTTQKVHNKNDDIMLFNFALGLKHLWSFSNNWQMCNQIQFLAPMSLGMNLRHFYTYDFSSSSSPSRWYGNVGVAFKRENFKSDGDKIMYQQWQFFFSVDRSL